MDRKLEKKNWPPRKIATLVGVLLFIAFTSYGFFKDRGVSRLNVEAQKLTVSTVQRAPFREFIPVRGSVLPIRTVYMDALEGGRVEERLIEEGGDGRKGRGDTAVGQRGSGVAGDGAGDALSQGSSSFFGMVSESPRL